MLSPIVTVERTRQVEREPITTQSQYVEIFYAILVPATIMLALFFGTMKLIHA